MKLIEDLGKRPVGLQGRVKRFGLFECPKCFENFECVMDNFRSKHTTKCRKCADKESAVNRSLEASGNFEDECNRVHNNRYNYFLVNYVNNHTKVMIICKEHGVFLQTPDKHKSGNGCPFCVGKHKAKRDFIETCSIVHCNRYDYTKVEYKTHRTKVEIICKEHGAFWQAPRDHKRGSGCPTCARTGFDPTKPAILYYLQVVWNNTVAFKIGITNRTVQERFTNTDLSKIKTVKTWYFLLGAHALEKEQEILRLYKEFKYTGEPLLSSGNTELFLKDVLEVITQQ